MDDLKIVERVLVEPGYRQAYKPAQEDIPMETHELSRLSALKKGQRVRAQVSTRHAALERGITEAELLRLMEAKGWAGLQRMPGSWPNWCAENMSKPMAAAQHGAGQAGVGIPGRALFSFVFT